MVLRAKPLDPDLRAGALRLVAGALVLSGGTLAAQNAPAARERFDPPPAALELVLETDPGSVEVEVVRYACDPKAPDQTGPCRLRVYRPVSAAASSSAVPVVVLAIEPDRGSPSRNPQYVAWAEALAGAGLATVMIEGPVEQPSAQAGGHQLRGVFDALRAHGAEWGLRGDRLGAFAFSDDVARYYEDIVARGSGVRCAALYYGAPPVYSSPGDTSLLVVSPGRDTPQRKARLRQFATRAMDAGANLEWVYHPAGHHAFDILDDTQRSRVVIARTVGFFRTELTADSLPGRSGDMLRRAADHVAREEWEAAAAAFGTHLIQEPNDHASMSQLAAAERACGRFGHAASSFALAAAGGYRPASTYFHAACMAARAGQVERSLALLESAAAAGFRDVDLLRRERDLEGLRREPGYAQLLRRLERSGQRDRNGADVPSPSEPGDMAWRPRQQPGAP